MKYIYWKDLIFTDEFSSWCYRSIYTIPIQDFYYIKISQIMVRNTNKLYRQFFFNLSYDVSDCFLDGSTDLLERD